MDRAKQLWKQEEKKDKRRRKKARKRLFQFKDSIRKKKNKRKRCAECKKKIVSGHRYLCNKCWDKRRGKNEN